jgi:DNA repair protein RadD
MTFILRDYQRESIDELHRYWQADGGNGLLVLPTGAGKSLVIAALCKEMLADYPTLRIGMLTHVRELIAQNYRELLALWPEAPAGIYSAGIGRRDKTHQILFMGIQSVYKRAQEIGAFDLILIDEAHLVSHNTHTTYRKLLDELREITPDMRVVGLTATPFRLDTGRLDTGAGKIFDDVVYDANVKDLIEQKYLCKLISKKTALQLDVSDVGKRGGEFITGELEIAIDKDWINDAIAKEMVAYDGGGKRRAWLAFCVTVKHAEHVVEALRAVGITTYAVFGHTPKRERDILIERFRAGEFTCLVSVMVLGIGFNVPHVDMICLLRPTASGGLFVQQVGRGLRNAEGKDNCLVLDFAGNTVRHGPIDMVRGRTKGAATESDAAKVKTCPTCSSLVPHGVMTCPDCGFVFPPAERQLPRPTADATTEIISVSLWHEVDRVTYQRHIKYGALDAPHTFRVNYICGYTTYSEWLCFDQLGYAREKALYWWRKRSTEDRPEPRTVTEALERANNGELQFPMRILVQPDGKFFKITKVDFSLQEDESGVTRQPALG